MPRPRPPHLHRQTTRHGKVAWYVRIGKGPRIRLRGEYGTPQFMSAYQAAVSKRPVPNAGKAATGTLAWLIARYRETMAWAALSSATRRQRDNIFLGVLKLAGAEPFAKVSRSIIVSSRDRRAATPAQARNFLDAMRGLFRWALEAGHVKIDPTAGVSTPRRQKGDGFPAWTEDDVARYQAKWPLGTKERVWLDVLLYTGLRRGDAVRFGRQRVKDGIGTIRTEKSGGEITVTIPILPVLGATLAAGRCGDLTFICGERRQPLTEEDVRQPFP